jgi:hypothetical protein
LSTFRFCGLQERAGDTDEMRKKDMSDFKVRSSLFTIASGLLLVLPLLLATPTKAFGYADPGTGAFVYQAAYAAFLGGTFYLRKFLDRFFRRRK